MYQQPGDSQQMQQLLQLLQKSSDPTGTLKQLQQSNHFQNLPPQYVESLRQHVMQQQQQRQRQQQYIGMQNPYDAQRTTAQYPQRQDTSSYMVGNTQQQAVSQQLRQDHMSVHGQYYQRQQQMHPQQHTQLPVSYSHQGHQQWQYQQLRDHQIQQQGQINKPQSLQEQRGIGLGSQLNVDDRARTQLQQVQGVAQAKTQQQKMHPQMFHQLVNSQQQQQNMHRLQQQRHAQPKIEPQLTPTTDVVQYFARSLLRVKRRRSRRPYTRTKVNTSVRSHDKFKGDKRGRSPGTYTRKKRGSDDDEDDMDMAIKVQREMKSVRPSRDQLQEAGLDPDDPLISRPQRRKARENRPLYTEEIEDLDAELDEIEETEKEKKRVRDLPPALFDVGDQIEYEAERIIMHRKIEDMPDNPDDHWSTYEFLVRWRHYAYVHATWETRDTLLELPGFKRVQNYIKREDANTMRRMEISREELEVEDVSRQIDEQLVRSYIVPERIIYERKTNVTNQVQYLVCWQNLPYAECTWEYQDTLMNLNSITNIKQISDDDDSNGNGNGTGTGQSPPVKDLNAISAQLINQFKARELGCLKAGNGLDGVRQQLRTIESAYRVQPDFLRGGTLRDYQLDGLNWLIRAWLADRNAILADEMGLGKTIQCVSFVSYLYKWDIKGPFLVVVPLSTVPNWAKEFKKWAPQLNTVVYVGNGVSRDVLRRFECQPSQFAQPSRQAKFEVMVTTYELVRMDAAILKEYDWSYLVVDEAHRLKNDQSTLYQVLKQWNFRNKLLVTGTPLQNSLKELWALLHFLEPSKFPVCEDFERRYSLSEADSVNQLHADLRPHLLRRHIKDVERSLPPKKERIIRVDMTPLQKMYYRWILSRNFKELNKGIRGGQLSLLNIICELKKCCNHPFLFKSAEEFYKGKDTAINQVERLVQTSGKMVLLNKLLKRLKSTGHRVLIFSQMVRMLDLVSEYLKLGGYPHQRLDGSTPPQARQQAMESFNSPNSKDFAFLLSTRAGGLGINLATADTVIIFDSDWNPQNDLQAMARAHRIGQKDTVNIYRLVTSNSVELDILERAKQKMVLDHLVIQRMDASGKTVANTGTGSLAQQMFSKDELASILRFGAEELFHDGNDKQGQANQQNMMDEDIDTILQRAEEVEARDQSDGANGLLSSFNVATFKTAETDNEFWMRLIPEADRPKKQVVVPVEPGVRSARLKIIEPGSLPDGDAGLNENDEDFRVAGMPLRPAVPGVKGRRGRKPGSKNKSKDTKRDEYGGLLGAVHKVGVWKVDRDDQGGVIDTSTQEVPTLELNRREANHFMRGVRRFGRVDRLADICEQAGGALSTCSVGAQYSLWYALVKGLETAVEICNKQGVDVKDAVLDFFSVSVKIQDTRTLLESIDILTDRLTECQDPLQLVLPPEALPKTPSWGHCEWSPTQDSRLLLGVYRHGIGCWEAISRDNELELGRKLMPAFKDTREFRDRLPKAAHLDTRVHALLRNLHRIKYPHTQPRKGRPPKSGVGGGASGAAASARGGGRKSRATRGEKTLPNLLGATGDKLKLESESEASSSGGEDMDLGGGGGG